MQNCLIYKELFTVLLACQDAFNLKKVACPSSIDILIMTDISIDFNLRIKGEFYIGIFKVNTLYSTTQNNTCRNSYIYMIHIFKTLTKLMGHFKSGVELCC